MKIASRTGFFDALLRLKIHNLLVVILFAALSVGCGKYGPPLAPELFSPQAVDTLEAKPQIDGIKFSWVAPTKNQRARELKSIDGYRIYRKTIQRPSDFTDKDVEFDLVSTLEDTHLLKLDELREQAKIDGKPRHRVKVDSDLTKFEFVDSALTPGSTYLYKVVPFNQGDVEGLTGKFVQIIFRGEASEIVLLDDIPSTDELL